MKSKVFVSILIIVLIFPFRALAERYALVYSPLLYKQEGAINILSLNKFLLHSSKSLNPFLQQTPALRFTKFIINSHLMGFTTIANHEIFGHGSVARELGGYATYKLWFNGFSWSGLTWYHNVTFDQNSHLFATAAGSEANQVLGFESQKYLYLKDKITADDFFLLFPKLDFPFYFFGTANPHRDLSKFLNSTGDPAMIIKRLCRKYYGDYSTQNILDTYDQMRNYSYYAIIDPSILMRFYSIYGYIFLNQYEYEMPGLNLYKYKIMFGTRCTYNPYGPDAYLDFYIKPREVSDPPLSIFYVRGGEYAGNTHWGLGVEFYNLKSIMNNVKLDFWHQPDDYGYNIEFLNKIKVNARCSLLLDTYYKTTGYLIGKPYGEGIRLFGGVELIL